MDKVYKQCLEPKNSSFFIGLVSIIFLLQGCGFESDVICRGYNQPKFQQAIINQLDEDQIEYHINNDNLICVTAETASKLERAQSEANEFYRGVAAMLTTGEERENVLGWLNNAKLPYQANESTHGLFVVVFSASRKEANENGKKLEALLGQHQIN